MKTFLQVNGHKRGGCLAISAVGRQDGRWEGGIAFQNGEKRPLDFLICAFLEQSRRKGGRL